MQALKSKKLLAAALMALSLLVYECKTSKPAASLPRDASGKIIVNPHPDPAFKSIPESMKAIYPQKGYHLQLVASEPMIKEPVAIVWDGNGRMYVAEMRTYMQDINGTGENEPVCQVSMLEDTNGDGVMDKRSTFIDSMVLPRMMLCVGHKLLVNETFTYNIFSYGDKNGDGKADEKIQVYKNDKPDTRNLEHQKSGLVWNMDNWIYVSCDPVRYRYTHGKMIPDTLAYSPGGQWGLGNDDYGRMYFSSAGAEIPATGFQINPVYGILNPRDQFNDEFQAVWPIIATPDVEGGLKRLRPDTTLNHFTASCGQSIYRGDALPADLRGDLLICEPVGRLIRRAKVTDDHGKITLHNAYDKEEFIASTDMNFRPVNTATGPDGCLYIVDMHHGIIQEGNWTREGSYLRPQILKKGLDKNIGQGRIYRLVYDGYKPDPRPHLLDDDANTLLTYLDHPNGWWRDNAQKELILRGNLSVVPALKQIALGQHPTIGKRMAGLARVHALWTLEGMDAIDKSIVIAAMNDTDPQVRRAAVWISERYMKTGEPDVIAKLKTMVSDTSMDVKTQLQTSLAYCSEPWAKNLLVTLVAHSDNKDFTESVANSIEVNKNTKVFGSRLANMPLGNRNMILAGAATYKQLCTTCHGPDGKGIVVGNGGAAAPPFVGSKRVGGDPRLLARILLNGLDGPVDGKTYPGVMAPFGATNSDAWIAEVLSYVRYEFNENNDRKRKFPVVVDSAVVKEIRLATANRTNMWTQDELEKTAQ